MYDLVCEAVLLLTDMTEGSWSVRTVFVSSSCDVTSVAFTVEELSSASDKRAVEGVTLKVTVFFSPKSSAKRIIKSNRYSYNLGWRNLALKEKEKEKEKEKKIHQPLARNCYLGLYRSSASRISYSFLPRNRIFGVDFRVIKKPIILRVRRTSKSNEQSTKCISHTVNMRKICLFYSPNNKIVWLENMADTLLRNSRGAQRFVGFCFLHCAFRVLIGRASKLWSRGCWTCTNLLNASLPVLC